MRDIFHTLKSTESCQACKDVAWNEYMLLAESDLDEATKSAALAGMRNGSFGQAEEPGAVDALRQQILSGQAGQAELATALLTGQISAQSQANLAQLHEEAKGELGPILRAWGNMAQGDVFELGVSIIRQKYEAGGLAAAAPWLASGEANGLAALTKPGVTPSEAAASPDDSDAEGFDVDGENGWDALYIDPDTYQLDPERAEAMREVQGWMEKTGMSAEAGWKNSVMGLAIHRELASLPDDMTITQSLIASLAGIVGDLPAYAAGGLVGTPGGPTTAASAAFAFTSGTRAALIDNIKHGGIKSVGDLKRNLESVIPAAIGGGVEGLALVYGGRLGKKLAGDATQKILGREAGAAAVRSGQAAGEVAALTHMGAAMRGEFPRPEEYLEAAATILTLKGAHAGVGHIGKEAKAAPGNLKAVLSAKLEDLYAKTGIKPGQAAEFAKADPEFLNDFESIVSGKNNQTEQINQAIQQDSRSFEFWFRQTGVEPSLTDRSQLRSYLDSLDPAKVSRLKLENSAAYLAVLRSIARKFFSGQEGGLRLRQQGGEVDYEHFVGRDVVRDGYLGTMLLTMKDADVRLEFKTPEGEAKAFLIKKYFEPEIQKDIWDMLVIKDNEIKTKIARVGKHRGQTYVESQIMKNTK